MRTSNMESACSMCVGVDMRTRGYVCIYFDTFFACCGSLYVAAICLCILARCQFLSICDSVSVCQCVIFFLILMSVNMCDCVYMYMCIILFFLIYVQINKCDCVHTSMCISFFTVCSQVRLCVHTSMCMSIFPQCLEI